MAEIYHGDLCGRWQQALARIVDHLEEECPGALPKGPCLLDEADAYVRKALRLARGEQ